MATSLSKANEMEKEVSVSRRVAQKLCQLLILRNQKAQCWKRSWHARHYELHVRKAEPLKAVLSHRSLCPNNSKVLCQNNAWQLSRFFSSVELPAQIPNLIIMILENVPWFDHLFCAESPSTTLEKSPCHVYYMPNLVSDLNDFVRDYRGRCLRIDHNKRHELVTEIYSVHPLGP